jgi:hypothetical protein
MEGFRISLVGCRVERVVSKIRVYWKGEVIGEMDGKWRIVDLVHPCPSIFTIRKVL